MTRIAGFYLGTLLSTFRPIAEHPDRSIGLLQLRLPSVAVEVPGDAHTFTCTLRDENHLFLRTKWFNTSSSVISGLPDILVVCVRGHCACPRFACTRMLSTTTAHISCCTQDDARRDTERYKKERQLAIGGFRGSTPEIHLLNGRPSLGPWAEYSRAPSDLDNTGCPSSVRRWVARFRAGDFAVYSLRNSLRFDGPHASGKCVGVSHGHLKPISPGCRTTREARREVGMKGLDGSGWIRLGQSGTGVESSTPAIASHARGDIIVLSDSDEETHNDDETGAGVMNGEGAPASERHWMTRGENIGPRSGYGSGAQRKPVYHTPDNRNDKRTSTFDRDSRSRYCRCTTVDRAQWMTRITEAETELRPWEARTRIGDSATGRSCHTVDEPKEDVVDTSSPGDLGDLRTPEPSPKKVDSNSDVHFPQADPEQLQSPTEIHGFSILPVGRDKGKDVRNMSEQPDGLYTREMGESKNRIASDGLEAHVLGAGDDDIAGVGQSVAIEPRSRRVDTASRGAVGRELPGPRGRPLGSGTEPQLRPKRARSVSRDSNAIGVTLCDSGRTQLDRVLRNTSSRRFSSAATPGGRPEHTDSYGHAPAADYEVKKKSGLQRPVPDSDFYCFDGDRGKENIEPNQVWALYDDIDTMPRTLIRVKEVSSEGPFWVKAVWLRPHNPWKKSERQKRAGCAVGCGDFEEPRESTIIRALNCFSHKVEFAEKTDTVIHVHPRKGEIWALHRRDNTGGNFKRTRSQKDRKGTRSDNNSRGPRLVVIVSDGGEDEELRVLVLVKFTGFRTLWAAGRKGGSLPEAYMKRLSHRVPAYKMTAEDYPGVNNLDVWDIDAAAVPACQSRVT